MAAMSSRERMLAALGHRPVDHVPCAFMIFGGLRQQCRDQEDFVERQLGMGLDAFVQLPPREPRPDRRRSESHDLYGFPVRFHPEAIIRDSREDRPGSGPTLLREYILPSGRLRTTVQPSDDWVHGDRIPIFDDYVIPRGRKRLVTDGSDLDCLRRLLVPPSRSDIAKFKEEAGKARAFAEKRDVLIVGEWGVLFDAACWLCGMEEAATKVIEEPEFIEELLDILGRWNQQRMKILLEAGVDVMVRRAWYETVDFLSPANYRRLVLPWVKRDAELAHQAGAKLASITTSAYAPIQEQYLEAGIDTLIGLDPVQDPRADFAATKRVLGGKVSLWGGVSGALTVERGTGEEIREAVRRAIEVLAPGGGFVLSPVDNVREDSPEIRANVEAFIAAWKEFRAAG